MRNDPRDNSIESPKSGGGNFIGGLFVGTGMALLGGFVALVVGVAADDKLVALLMLGIVLYLTIRFASRLGLMKGAAITGYVVVVTVIWQALSSCSGRWGGHE